MRIYLVYTDHNRYGEQFQAAFAFEEDANKLKSHLDQSIDGWENTIGGIVVPTDVYDSYDQYLSEKDS